MSAECFLDTNILVYAASAAPEDAEKQSVALELVRKEDFGLSAQVLHGQQYGPVRVINPFTYSRATSVATAACDPPEVPLPRGRQVHEPAPGDVRDYGGAQQ